MLVGESFIRGMLLGTRAVLDEMRDETTLPCAAAQELKINMNFKELQRTSAIKTTRREW